MDNMQKPVQVAVIEIMISIHSLDPGTQNVHHPNLTNMQDFESTLTMLLCQFSITLFWIYKQEFQETQSCKEL